MTIGSDLMFERGRVMSAAGGPDDRLLLKPQVVVRGSVGPVTRGRGTRRRAGTRWAESLFPAAVEAARVREQEDRVMYPRTVSASHRVAGCLCDLANLVDPRPDSAVVEIERRILTQQQMAHYIGCARDAVDKTFASFAARGWLELHPSRIRVPYPTGPARLLEAAGRRPGARPRESFSMPDLMRLMHYRVDCGTPAGARRRACT